MPIVPDTMVKWPVLVCSRSLNPRARNTLLLTHPSVAFDSKMAVTCGQLQWPHLTTAAGVCYYSQAQAVGHTRLAAPHSLWCKFLCSEVLQVLAITAGD